MSAATPILRRHPAGYTVDISVVTTVAKDFWTSERAERAGRSDAILATATVVARRADGSAFPVVVAMRHLPAAVKEGRRRQSVRELLLDVVSRDADCAVAAYATC